MPGHSREGQFCWSGSALGTRMPPLHHLPAGACCSLLLFCHLLQGEASCPSMLPIPWVSQRNHGNPQVPHSELLIHTPMRFLGKGGGCGSRQHLRACPGTRLGWHCPMQGSSWAKEGALLSTSTMHCIFMVSLEETRDISSPFHAL